MTRPTILFEGDLDALDPQVIAKGPFVNGVYVKVTGRITPPQVGEPGRWDVEHGDLLRIVIDRVSDTHRDEFNFGLLYAEAFRGLAGGTELSLLADGDVSFLSWDSFTPDQWDTFTAAQWSGMGA